MPANAENVKLYTAESNGSVNSWKTRQSFDGNVTIDPDTSAVSVSGFSFKDNWCGNETIDGQARFHDGKKIIIEFTVKPKAGFLGGNKVSEVWKHDTTESTTVTMLGDKPALDITYTPDNSKIFDGKHIGGTAEIPDFTPGEGWVKYGDYYYYTQPVAPNAKPATNLISSITLTGSYTDADGGMQAIDVMAEAIQSVPADAVKAAWGAGFGINADGSLAVPKGVER